MPARKTLTVRQKTTLKRHAPHHTQKHMRFMKKKMLAGHTFMSAHKLAMKTVGK